VCKAEISCGLHYNCARCDFDLHCKCPNPVDEGYSYSEGYSDGDRTRDVAQDGTAAMPYASSYSSSGCGSANDSGGALDATAATADGNSDAAQYRSSNCCQYGKPWVAISDLVG